MGLVPGSGSRFLTRRQITSTERPRFTTLRAAVFSTTCCRLRRETGAEELPKREAAGLDLLVYLSAEGVAEATPHSSDGTMIVGERIKVLNTNPDQFNGFYEVSRVDAAAGTF